MIFSSYLALFSLLAFQGAHASPRVLAATTLIGANAAQDTPAPSPSPGAPPQGEGTPAQDGTQAPPNSPTEPAKATGKSETIPEHATQTAKPAPEVPDKPEAPKPDAAASTPQNDGAVPPRGATNRAVPGWRSMDRIVMIVNEDMLTSQLLQKDLDRFRRQANVPKKDEPGVLLEIQRSRVKTFLEVQAGQDLGLDPALVKRQISDSVERLIHDRFNGVSGLADYLQSKDIDSLDLRTQIKNEIYADFWEKYITGEGAIPGQRPSRDRYVRPGILKLYFENGLQHPENLEQIGGKQQEVVLQYLFIDEQTQGGETQAKNMLKTLRQRILDGEDMGDICEHHSASHTAKKDRGLLPARPEARYAEVDAPIGAFLATAKPGDVSDLMLFKTDGGRFWRIAKLVERIPAVMPDLGSAAVQQKLMQRVQEDYDALRKGVALEQMFRASYVWPNELTPR